MSDARDLVTTSRRGQAGWVRLDHAEVMNALSGALLSQMETALADALGDPAVRAVVLTGTGTAFCAGVDLKEISDRHGSVDAEALLAYVAGRVGAVIERIALAPKPVIAAVNGIAVAGGLELALACDLIVAGASARLGDAHANYGLIPGGGASVRLPRRVGPAMAKRLMFTGEFVGARRSLDIGLVDEVVPDEGLVEYVDELVGQLANKSPSGIAAMKRLVDGATDQTTVAGLEAELREFGQHVRGDDVREGLLAFREKRAPVFRDA